MNSKNLYSLAFAIAFISGVLGSLLTADITAIATFLLIGTGVWIGWTCVRSANAKDYAIGAAALVFLNHAGWGDAGATMNTLPVIGPMVNAIFDNLTNLVLTIAAVGMLKSLVDGAQPSTSSM